MGSMTKKAKTTRGTQSKEDVVRRARLARTVIRRLKKEYPVTGPFLDWTTPLELVVATALSAQCTDERVNKVTKELFKKYKSAEDYAEAHLAELERDVYSTGFYRNKARNLQKMGEVLMRDFGGEVPDNFADLQKLPGVAKKTAAIIMSKVWGVHESVAVDTHVHRIAPFLGLTEQKSIEGIRRDLNVIVPPKDYLAINELMITHGRAVCVARRPQCVDCILLDLCPQGQENIKEL